ncbi:beta-ketoacyl synthase chain length factor [Bacteroides thetaiotaomicron]|uniref:beta-ketoacyl synthase chain length factor n=1 Tax=Bacteroides thetaiotaomicron TaxID=818 RepID=UPI001F281627|nr:beta-ketoacyl synthase chain length factor [Bacteroides thetaiotaomicron]MCE8950511.1 beta-ketoacyl synthase chain length factor [Bacteroides thetaiotaomicron]MCE8968026.1 beta-ketoacyl synthase chain length factor [Bacteroides thetaiotaomicron]
MQPVYIQHTASIHPQGNPENHPYLSACEPNYKVIITNATLRRRMSRIIKMGVACGLECIADIAPEKIQGIITATGLGCLSDTEKFLNTLIDNEERMLNPTPFIQSTFNTIGAQIALLRQIHAYNMTYVHRGLSFESALLDALMKIEEGSENILVGAVDEITDSSYIIQQRLGLLKGIQAGEGAQFFLLSREAGSHPLAEIRGVETYAGKQTAEEISSRISRFLQQYGLEPQDIHWLITGKTGPTDETDTVITEENGFPVQDGSIKGENEIYKKLETELFPNSLSLSFKDECGEYPTASSYAVWKAVKVLASCNDTVNLLIYNHHHSINHSLMLIRKSV